MQDEAMFRPSSEPRLLHQVTSPCGDDGSSLLSAWVGSCAAPGERSAHTGWVALEGELDAFSSSLLRDPLFDFATSAGELVVDLRALRFIDSSGVELLEEVTQLQLGRGGFVRLHEPRPFVRRVMQLVTDAKSATAAIGRTDGEAAGPRSDAPATEAVAGAAGRSVSTPRDGLRPPQIGARTANLEQPVFRLDEVSFTRF